MNYIVLRTKSTQADLLEMVRGIVHLEFDKAYKEELVTEPKH